MLLPIKSLDQFQWGSVPVTAKTIWEVCWRKAQEQAQHCCSLRVCPVICSSWKDVRHRIKIAVRVAVPRKPCSLLLASYTTLSRGDFPWSFACCCHLCNFSLCQLGLYGFPKHFRLFFHHQGGCWGCSRVKRLLQECSREPVKLELLLVVLIHMVSLCSRVLGSFCLMESRTGWEVTSCSSVGSVWLKGKHAGKLKCNLFYSNWR